MFEYEIREFRHPEHNETMTSQHSKFLSQMGKDGWELVSTYHRYYEHNFIVFFFKRTIEG